MTLPRGKYLGYTGGIVGGLFLHGFVARVVNKYGAKAGKWKPALRIGSKALVTAGTGYASLKVKNENLAAVLRGATMIGAISTVLDTGITLWEMWKSRNAPKTSKYHMRIAMLRKGLPYYRIPGIRRYLIKRSSLFGEDEEYDVEPVEGFGDHVKALVTEAFGMGETVDEEEEDEDYDYDEEE